MRLFRKKLSTLDIMFIIIGGRFYMDWILPTNPASKNPVWRFIISPIKESYSSKNLNGRFIQSFVFISIHVVGLLFYIIGDGDFLSNLLVNIYPIIVNTYIAIRINNIIRKRKKGVSEKEILFNKWIDMPTHPYINWEEFNKREKNNEREKKLKEY